MYFDQITSIIALVINGLVAAGTIGLAVFAFIDVRRFTREQRERNINEIIEWAISAREWNFTDEDNVRLPSSSDPWATSWIILSRHVEILTGILRNGHIMQKLALRFKKPKLIESINIALQELIRMQMHLITLQKQIDFKATQTPPTFIAALDSLITQQTSLRQAAENVVNEAAEHI